MNCDQARLGHQSTTPTHSIKDALEYFVEGVLQHPRQALLVIQTPFDASLRVMEFCYHLSSPSLSDRNQMLGQG